jgi:uncharacterized linocin/CFP29 family protein
VIGLNRHLAPLTRRAWQQLEGEAGEVLRLHLAARRLMDFDGPHGWTHSAVDLGRLAPTSPASAEGVLVRRRVVRPLLELRLGFTLAREELERIDRGATDVDLRPLRDAARAFAAAEDRVLFSGDAGTDTPGLLTGREQKPVALPRDPLKLPDAITHALEQLRLAGVAGPYAAALGPAAHAALSAGAGDGGYPVARHVESLIGRPALFAPSLAGGIVVSLRGKDFRIVSGCDIAIGYERHDERTVTLFFQESLSVVVDAPEAAVPLVPNE